MSNFEIEISLESEITIDSKPITLRPASWPEIIDLRFRILYDVAGLTIDQARYVQDETPAARYFAAFDKAGNTIACLTLLESTWEDRPAWQLRGMAVDRDWQGRGIGQQLLTLALESIKPLTPRQIWCNARTPATRFYQRQGWTRLGEEFDIPRAGPHFKMMRAI